MAHSQALEAATKGFIEIINNPSQTPQAHQHQKPQGITNTSSTSTPETTGYHQLTPVVHPPNPQDQ
jgi:hypothetical protein